jgi:hypothetical protein
MEERERGEKEGINGWNWADKRIKERRDLKGSERG